MKLPLNPEQRAAVEHGEGPLLVLAGAGSGKTRVLTVRAARLIEEAGVAPERVLAVTFTNRAADEMRDRIAALLGRRPRGLWTGTFHSIAARILRREIRHVPRSRGFTIYDEEDSLRALGLAMEEAGIDPDHWRPRSLLRRISRAKNSLLAPGELRENAFDLRGRRAAEVYPAYEAELRRSNALDFDDLLVHAVRLLEGVEEVRESYGKRFVHVLVDEYQDTNRAQYRLVRALGRGHENVCVVGDDDQSIYGWRGADLRNILDFERDFPGARVVRLERNYRSTERILRTANAVIAHNSERKPKELRAERERGERVTVVSTPDEREEARWTVREVGRLSGRYSPGDCAVLYRTNAQSRPYEEALRRAGVPYRVVGGVRFYERREIRDALAYLELVANPSSDAAFLRAVKWPRRGVGSVTLDRLRAARRDDESLMDAAARAETIAELPGRGARALARFAERIGELRDLRPVASVETVLEECVARFGLRSALEAEEDGGERLENLGELLAGAAEFDPAEAREEQDPVTDDLELYLQHVALLSDADQYDAEEGAVSLMTLHNAKGLEFPVVFIGGLERGLFPLSRSEDSESEYQEERRLFYVGITRAEDRLYLTHADRRWRAGSGSESSPSPFLDELPAEPVERRRVARAGDGSGGWSGGRASRSAERTGGGFAWRRRPGGVATSEREAEGVRYDYSESQLRLELEAGARIVHPEFGEGTVVSVSGAGGRTKVEIEFDEAGRKKVMAGYAGLRPA